jgi:hypothetical protein
LKDSNQFDYGSGIKYTFHSGDFVLIDPNGNIIPTDFSSDTVLILKRAEPTGIRRNAALTMHLYPNPANTELIIESALKNAQVSIHDIIGNEIMHSAAPSGNALLHTETLPNGIYLISVWNNENCLQTKVVVRH